MASDQDFDASESRIAGSCPRQEMKAAVEGVSGMSDERLANLALNDNGFLFDATTGHTYTLNETGTFVLKRMIARREKADLLADLAAQYDISCAVAARDLEQFLMRLRSMGILDEE